MKILVNAISARMGGIVTYTMNLMPALSKRGADVRFAVPEDFPGTDERLMLRLGASMYSPARRFAWEQTTWRRVVRREKPDLLFSSANFALLHSPVPQVLLIREGGLFDPFYLVNVAAEQGLMAATMRHVRRRLMLASAHQATLVITPTQAMRDLLIRWDSALENKIRVTPYGTLTDVFKPTAGRQWREDGLLRLIYVSVYYPHKNPGILCRAIEMCNADGLATVGTITMTSEEIGRARGGARDAFHVNRAAAAKLITLGRRSYSDLPTLYRAHDVFVFPSVSETFGHPMAEAMASGLPIVAADTPVHREICGDAALYFSPFSAAELVRCLKQLEGDPKLRRTLRERGLSRAQAQFTWDRHVDSLLDAFGSVKL